MQLSEEFIQEVLKQQNKEKRAAIRRMNKGDYPIDKLFLCPYCKYIPKHGEGTAKIFSENNNFFCFYCQKRSLVKR